MKQITDYKEYSPLVMKYFRRGIITNNFLTPKEAAWEISEGRLFYDAESALKLYLKRNGFYILYFYARPEDGLGELIKERLICEAPVRAEDMLISSGFKRTLERIKLEADGRGNTFDYENSKAADAEEIYKIFCECFSPQTAFLPSITQLRSECDSGLLRTARTDNEISAVLRFGESKASAAIKHLCVRKNARKKGLARQLCGSLLNDYEKCSVWTGTDNRAAVSLYESMGFCKTAQKSTVYTLN